MILIALLIALAGHSKDSFPKIKCSVKTQIPAGSENRKKFVSEISEYAKAEGYNDEELKNFEKALRRYLKDPRINRSYCKSLLNIVSPKLISKQNEAHETSYQRLMTPEMMKAAKDFKKKYRTALKRAAEKHKIDANVVVSILAWESNFGKNMGKYFVANVFLTQILFIDKANKKVLPKISSQKDFNLTDYQNRLKRIENRAKANFVALLIESEKRKMDALSVRGSWAGAIGIPQFMPASLKWADTNRKGSVVNLLNMSDAIFSVANYLREHDFAADPFKAVFAYNNDSAYAEGVLKLAKSLAI
jgi:membrane-bound lytic murein transglycosylase B